MRDYCKQLYANKMDNLEEMDKLFEKHNLTRLNQEEIENINRTITTTETEAVIKNLPTNKSPGPDYCILIYRHKYDSFTSKSLKVSIGFMLMPICKLFRQKTT